jgi:phenylpropionate dioxygenase-like ring-hydroxylating dioxygenase large terminal subunit
MYSNGWYQVGFEEDLTAELTPAAIGSRHLALVRTGTEVRAFDAVCPHRGAHLAMGGRYDREAIICPFHGYRIGLGREGEHGFRVHEYRTLVIGGLVFVSLSDTHDMGFRAYMEQLAQTHLIVPGFSLPMRTRPELVVENAFDNSHFRTVHHIQNEPRFRILPSQTGEFGVEGTLQYGDIWKPGGKPTDRDVIPFVARAFSPGVVLGSLGGYRPYTVLTAATPVTENDCLIRLSLIIPVGEGNVPPDKDYCLHLLRGSKAGLEMDRVIWENISTTAPCHYTAQDAAMLAFREFCSRFEEDLQS